MAAEKGTAMTAERALNLLGRSNDWLHERLTGRCECGACYLCAYLYVQRAVNSHAALVAALRSLANEASGFLALADRETHGNTNIAVLQHHIDNARAELAQAEGREA